MSLTVLLSLQKSGEALAKKILEVYDIVYLFLKEVLKAEYNVIGINLSDWDYLKIDYNANKEKYVHKPETVKLSEVFVDKKNEENDERNSIDEMFNDIIVIE